jgi:hypothetical protein
VDPLGTIRKSTREDAMNEINRTGVAGPPPSGTQEGGNRRPQKRRRC